LEISTIPFYLRPSVGILLEFSAVSAIKIFGRVHFRATKIAERVVGLDRDVATLIFGKIPFLTTIPTTIWTCSIRKMPRFTTSVGFLYEAKLTTDILTFAEQKMR
jgi:hypothetical protein